MSRRFIDFVDWCASIDPTWVGFVVCVTVVTAVAVFMMFAAMYSIYLTNGWSLLAIPALIGYCFYVALFMQDAL